MEAMETTAARETEESTEAALRSALAELEQSRREAACVAQEQAATLTERWQTEVHSYKVSTTHLLEDQFITNPPRSSPSSMQSPLLPWRTDC